MKKSDKNLIIIMLIVLLILFAIVSESGVRDCVQGGNSRDYCERELLK